MFSRKSNIGRARPIRRCNAERLEFAGYRRLLNAIFAGEPIEVTLQSQPPDLRTSSYVVEERSISIPEWEAPKPERVVVPDAVLLWRYQNFIEPNPKMWN